MIEYEEYLRYSVICNACGEIGPIGNYYPRKHGAKTSALDVAKFQGWVISGNQNAYCPECSEGEENNERKS